MFALLLPLALAAHTPDFDGDGQTDLAVAVGGPCGAVDLWLSSARNDDASPSVTLRPSSCRPLRPTDLSVESSEEGDRLHVEGLGTFTFSSTCPLEASSCVEADAGEVVVSGGQS